MITVDFEKAFDSLNWNYLEKCLTKFNFGNRFIAFIKTMYNNIQSAVTNNGHISDFFTLERGVRQGCPLSAYLFLIAIETLGHNIRTNENIEGIKIHGQHIKVSQLADDMTCYINNSDSIKHLLAIFKMFSLCSGLKINLDKTKAKYIGSLKSCDHYPHGLSWIKEPIETLGIVFTENEEDNYKCNFAKRIKNLSSLLNIWKQRNLSIKGKVINSLALSPLIYLSSVFSTPKRVTDEVDKIILDFLWNGGSAKIAKSTLVQSVENGGLKLCDFQCKKEALLIAWVKRMTDVSPGRWKLFPQYFYKYKNLNMYFQAKQKLLKCTDIPPFYIDIHNIWMKLYPVLFMK